MTATRTKFILDTGIVTVRLDSFMDPENKTQRWSDSYIVSLGFEDSKTGMQFGAAYYGRELCKSSVVFNDERATRAILAKIPLAIATEVECSVAFPLEGYTKPMYARFSLDPMVCLGQPQ